MRLASGYYDPPLLADRLAEAESGRFVSAQSVEEWVASWFTPDELPPPDADISARSGP